MGANQIVHIEFSANDPDAAAKFYSGLFDWEIQSWPEYKYATFNPKEGPGGGFANIDGDQYKAGDVLVYIQTDDLEGMLSRIEAAGGMTVLTRTAIDEKSWYAFFVDPSGNRVGLYTNDPAKD